MVSSENSSIVVLLSWYFDALKSFTCWYSMDEGSVLSGSYNVAKTKRTPYIQIKYKKGVRT